MLKKQKKKKAKINYLKMAFIEKKSGSSIKIRYNK